MTDLYLQTLIALSVVIGTIYLLGMFLKKRQEKDGMMKVMGFQSLGPKKGIAMVKVGQEVLLVAVTATDVKLLKSLDQFTDPASVNQQQERTAGASLASASAPSDAIRFADELENVQAQEKVSRVITANAATGTNLSRLKALKDTLLCL